MWNKGLKGAQVAWNKGIPNPEFGAKMRESRLGKDPWNKGKVGTPAWNKGIPWPQEMRDRISANLKGKNYASSEARRLGQLRRYSDPEERRLRSELTRSQWAKKREEAANF